MKDLELGLECSKFSEILFHWLNRGDVFLPIATRPILQWLIWFSKCLYKHRCCPTSQWAIQQSHSKTVVIRTDVRNRSRFHWTWKFRIFKALRIWTGRHFHIVLLGDVTRSPPILCGLVSEMLNAKIVLIRFRHVSVTGPDEIQPNHSPSNEATLLFLWLVSFSSETM